MNYNQKKEYDAESLMETREEDEVSDNAENLDFDESSEDEDEYQLKNLKIKIPRTQYTVRSGYIRGKNNKNGNWYKIPSIFMVKNYIHNEKKLESIANYDIKDCRKIIKAMKKILDMNKGL